MAARYILANGASRSSAFDKYDTTTADLFIGWFRAELFLAFAIGKPAPLGGAEASTSHFFSARQVELLYL